MVLQTPTLPWKDGRVLGRNQRGHVINKDSPLSGLLRVRVYNPHGMAQSNNAGMFPRQVISGFLLMAHSPKHYTETGHLVADADKQDWDEWTAGYGAMPLEGLSVMGTQGKHVNVLQHLMGFLKHHLVNQDEQELQGPIEDSYPHNSAG